MEKDAQLKAVQEALRARGYTVRRLIAETGLSSKTAQKAFRADGTLTPSTLSHLTLHLGLKNRRKAA